MANKPKTHPTISPHPKFTLDLPQLSFSNAAQASLDRWKSDLKNLLRHASNRFADIAWALQPGGEETICAHKAIIYARASGQFQLKYLSAPAQARHSRLPNLPSNSSVYIDSSMPSTTPGSLHSHPRSPSPSISSLNPSTRQLALLNGTDPTLFQSILEALYTANGLSEVFAFLFDDHLAGDSPEARTDKLRKDLLYMWRSKLYADCQIVLINQHDLDNPTENGTYEQEAIFAAHRSILCSRSPYFASLLLDPYADSNNRVFTLASPPFTPASLHFSLGYLYCGTLDFSNRNFDLSTAMQIWRSAQYLGLELLREEVEAKISDMCHNFKDTCKSCISRIGRVYAFSVALDVASKRLEKATQPFIIQHFGAIWNKAIGELDYVAQTHLVDLVCLSIDPNTVVNAIQGSKRLKERLAGERSDWADHLLSMLEPIDEQIGLVMQKKFPAVVTSKGFQDLLVGVGFSNDVLEKVLITMVSKLTDQNAAEAYQVLVGQILLREDGIPMDARVIVEDAKAGVLKYIKSHWTTVRVLNGFDPLENWALKEISDEIEVPVEDLLISTSPPTLRTKTGLQVTAIPSKSSCREDVPSSVSTSTLRASVLSRRRAPSKQRPSNLSSLNTTRTSCKSENASVKSPVSATPSRIITQTKISSPSSCKDSDALRSVENRVSPTDSPGQKRILSKIPTGSPALAKNLVAPRPNGTSSSKIERDSKAPAVSTSKSAGSTTTFSHPPGTPVKPRDSRANSPAQSISSVTSKEPRTRTASSASKVRRPLASKTIPIASATKPPRTRAVTSGSVDSTRSAALSTSVGQRKSVANLKPPTVRKISSSISIQSQASTATVGGFRSRANTHSQKAISTTAVRKGSSSPVGLSFSPKADRLRTTSATARTDAAVNIPVTVPVTVSKRPSSVISVRTTKPRGSSMSTSGTLSPTRATPTSAKTSKLKARNSHLPPLPSSDPSSTSSSKTQKVSSTSSILSPRAIQFTKAVTGGKSNDSTEVLTDLTVSSEVSDAPSHHSKGSSVSNSTVRLPPATSTSKTPSSTTETFVLPPKNIIVTPSSTQSINKLAAAPSLAANEQQVAPTKPPGTALLIGIPCVVATTATLEDGLVQPIKFRAVVKYLGQTYFGPGQWVGVEVAEKEEMSNKEWNDGTVNGIRYFELGQESKESKSRLFRNLSATPSGSGSHFTPMTGDRSHSSNSHYLNPATNGNALSNSEDAGSLNSLRPSVVSKASSITRTVTPSSHTDEERATRGLFVRPQEVIFVF